MEALAPTYRILRYDTRGHGQSAAPPAPYTLAALGEDLLALLDHLQIHRAAVCGISLGGATALWLAAHAPARITAIVAANTSARIGSAEGWTGRIAQVERAGVSSLYPTTLERWFTPSFLAQHPELPAVVEQTLATVSKTGYIGCCAALRDADLHDRLASIAIPTLIVAGAHDHVTTPAEAHLLATRIPEAQLATLDAAHLSNIEDAPGFNRALLHFLQQTHPSKRGRTMNDEDRHNQGMEIRRAVLGPEHVQRATDAITPFSAPFQDLITRYAWGEIWARPGLPRHTRSLLTIAMMVALGRSEELRLHLRAAANNGVTREEIQEVLLQTAIYCGVPAANHAFHLAAEVFAQMDAPSQATA